MSHKNSNEFEKIEKKYQLNCKESKILIKMQLKLVELIYVEENSSDFSRNEMN